MATIQIIYDYFHSHGANTRYIMIWIRVSRDQSSPVGQDEAGPSDVQSFSDSLKLRLQSVSTKYTSSSTVLLLLILDFFGSLKHYQLKCPPSLPYQVQGFYNEQYTRVEGKVVHAEEHYIKSWFRGEEGGQCWNRCCITHDGATGNTRWNRTIVYFSNQRSLCFRYK